VGSVESENPTFLAIHPTGRFLYAANGGGSICMLPINEDGSLNEASDFVQHEGSSVNAKRQQGPHAHSANISPNNRSVYIADLGLDKVLIYDLDLDNGKLVPHDPPSVTVAPGEGPRHFAFHPNGQYAYLINEIGNTVNTYAYDVETGNLTELQSITNLPSDFTGTNHTADIHVSPDGKFVYGSNRGHDSITIYAIDESTGQLTLVGHQSTGGQSPRNIALAPDGNHLLAENQGTGTIVSFVINRDTGELTAAGHEVEVSRPVCLKFLQR
jgi:6-phosphogluconolactonase